MVKPRIFRANQYGITPWCLVTRKRTRYYATWEIAVQALCHMYRSSPI